MSERPDHLDDVLRAHGGAPAHLPHFVERLETALGAADREMGRAAGVSWWRRLRARLTPRGAGSAAGRRLAVVATVVVVGAGVTVAFLIGIPGVSRVTGPEPVSAAEVIQRMLRAFAECETLQADVTGKLQMGTRADGTPTYAVEHSRQQRRSDGSFHYVRLDKPDMSVPPRQRVGDDARETAYDAVHGVYRDYFRGWDWDAGADASYVRRYTVTTGYPLGDPDYGEWMEAATGRALLAAGRATLETTAFEGRPAWELTCDTGVGAGLKMPYDEVAVITVDQQTCLPIGTRLIRDGVVLLESRWTNVVVDEPLPDAVFTFPPPKGAKVVREDAGFRRLPLERIAATIEYVPLVPARLPAGYALTWTAAAERVVTDEGPHSGRDVVHLQYVRGFDRLTVTTRIAADPQLAATTDPMGDRAWSDLVGRDVELTKGAFAGVTARVVVGPWISMPHLFVVKGDMLLTIAGAATADELVAIAESLEPYHLD